MARNSSYNQFGLSALTNQIHLQRGLVFGIMIIGALFAFELFNFSTTEFALGDLLGQSSFMSVRWSTILALAFCGIDFAGIARLFTPEEGADEPAEVWYLFGAWLLAATMNAMLTWWGVSIAILNHETLGNAVVDRSLLLKIVPVFVAIMVWLSRVLIIGTFSVSGERLFSQSDRPTSYSRFQIQQRSNNRSLPKRVPASQTALSHRRPTRVRQPAFQPAPNPSGRNMNSEFEETSAYSQPEPTYHPISMRAGDGRPPGYR